MQTFSKKQRKNWTCTRFLVHLYTVQAVRLMAASARASKVKGYLEEKYKRMRRDGQAKQQRLAEFESQLAALSIGEDEKAKRRTAFRRQELRAMRQMRKRMSTADFESLATIGRGAFGEVRLVKQRDTNRVLALKTMVKEAMVVKNQVTHVRCEKTVLLTFITEFSTYFV